MLNKNNLEKIIINSSEDLKIFEGQYLNDKYLLIKSPIKDIKLGTLEGCVIEGGGIVCRKLSKCNLYDVEYVYAEESEISIYQNCEKIQLGDTDENYKVLANQFFKCKEILITDSSVDDCIFNDFLSLYLTNVTMNNCLFMNAVCNENCAINIENSNVEDCSFENMEMRNNSYLIEGDNSSLIKNSVFLRIRTSRDDTSIFRNRKKSNQEVPFVDRESCSGLMFIADLDGTINIGSFDLEYSEGEE